MRNYIVYFLTSLFLLFIVESKINVKTLHNHLPDHVSHHLPKKANRLNQTYDKLSIQQMLDNVDNSSLELTEDDFQLSDTAQNAVLFVGVFSLVYFFGLFNYRRLKPNIQGFISSYSSVKKFILIRSIRI
ncbi:hypothetical protein CEY12_18800 [Chryseobacterium sp. T16E-39]|uniref:hypothetical protein n=1 Tax=Chryseobacterium sp. T16E-39 TaxID=2015076 RepID=UPI000B5B1521|nr:hypothetical protein [Chryseobacterium sp. T16E-39]ASK32022.1 hypothetical protein CEY12_18800 [Chryseobacterium sp. T16E-39]